MRKLECALFSLQLSLADCVLAHAKEARTKVPAIGRVHDAARRRDRADKERRPGEHQQPGHNYGSHLLEWCS